MRKDCKNNELATWISQPKPYACISLLTLKIELMREQGYKFFLVCGGLILAAWFGGLSQAHADNYDKLNTQRMKADLQPLTRDDRADFQILVRECNDGIRFSCFLAQQIQKTSLQRQRPTVNSPQQPGWKF